MDLPGLMFINEEYGNRKVVVDGGEVTRNNDGKRSFTSLYMSAL